MKIRFMLMLALVSVTFIFSCKKSNVNDPASVDLNGVIKSINGDWGTSTFSYNDAGKCTQVQYSNGSKTVYEYLAGKVNQKSYNNSGVNTATYSYDLNADGFVIKETRPMEPGFSEVTTYNSDNQLVKSVTIQNGNTQNMDMFYHNGNNDSTRFTNNGNWSLTIKFTYYTDKANTLGNKNYGIAFYGNDSKNLLKSEQYCYPDGSTLLPTNYTYELDGKGRVTKETSTQGVNTSISYYSY